MNQEPSPHPEEAVTTEPQRIALERMSAELVHKLNVMIADQEERVRIFSEQHHSQSPLPQHPVPEMLPETPSVPPTPVPEPAAKPLVAKFKAIARRSVPPLVTSSAPTPKEEQPQPRPIPVLTTPRKTSESKEEGSIGVGTIVTGIVIILFLLRACS